MTAPPGSPLGDAVAAVLVDRGRRAGSVVTVGHPDDPLFIAVERGTGRVVPAPGAGARLLVGNGVAAAGAPAAVLTGAAAVVPRGSDGNVTAITHDPSAAEALRRAGWTVAQPVWASDVAPLLAAAADDPRPVVLRLHTRDLGRGDAPAPELGDQRVLAEGNTGVVVAAGALVADVRAARPSLRSRGLDLAVVDAHTRTPHGATTALADPERYVLVGGPQAAAALAAGRLRPGALEAVEITDRANLATIVAERIPLHG